MSATRITQAFLREHLDYDPKVGVFTWKKTLANKSKVGSEAGEWAGAQRKYRSITMLGQRIRSHRLAWLWVYGSLPPKGTEIDHINGNKSDNRISNLRVVTRSQNMANRKKTSTGKNPYKGAYRHSGGYLSCITVNYKQIYLGFYKTAEEAALAYNAAAAKHFGEHARLNEVRQ